jgi:hypothetical protein
MSSPELGTPTRRPPGSMAGVPYKFMLFEMGLGKTKQSDRAHGLPIIVLSY